MNRKMKKSKYSYKSFIFWGLIAAVTVAFFVAVVIGFINNHKISKYESIDHVIGQQAYQQEGTYFVLIYDSTVQNPDIDENVFNYASFANANKKNEAVYKIYCFDIRNTENKKCLASDNNITGTTTFPSSGLNASSSASMLQVAEGTLPLLLQITNGEVAKFYEGENKINQAFQSIIDANSK